jgi:hypothetical protein
VDILNSSKMKGAERERGIIIIIIFIQLQLGWNPVAEVYNTYTANV